MYRGNFLQHISVESDHFQVILV